MNFPIATGEKYALIALNAGTEIREPVDLSDGYLALPGGAFDLPLHWKESLGTIRTKAIERAPQRPSRRMALTERRFD